MTPPILGIFASAVTGGVSATSFESIATTTVGAGGASSITFSSIPAGYTHLQIRCMSRDNRLSASENNISAYFNSDSAGTNYYWHLLEGSGSSAYSDSVPTNSAAPLSFGLSASNNAASGIYGVSVVDILDYANTNKYKTIREITGIDRNGSGYIRFASGLWSSTSAITTINLYPQTSVTFSQYSHFALYGIKGAA
jgi:hypothetical protein